MGVVTVRSDNVTTVSCINKGTSRNWRIMKAIRRLFWLSVKFNFKLRVLHIPGRRNHLADVISRLHEPGRLKQLQALLPRNTYPLDGHMSYRSLYVLQDLFQNDRPTYVTWMAK